MLLAYSKIWLNNHLLASDVPEDPYLSTELERYFPRAVRSASRAPSAGTACAARSSPPRPPTAW